MFNNFRVVFFASFFVANLFVLFHFCTPQNTASAAPQLTPTQQQIIANPKSAIKVSLPTLSSDGTYFSSLQNVTEETLTITANAESQIVNPGETIFVNNTLNSLMIVIEIYNNNEKVATTQVTTKRYRDVTYRARQPNTGCRALFNRQT